jgi:hypothetical protein
MEVARSQRVVAGLGELPGLVGRGGVRHDLVRAQLANGVADHLVIVGQLEEIERHGASECVTGG